MREGDPSLDIRISEGGFLLRDHHEESDLTP